MKSFGNGLEGFAPLGLQFGDLFFQCFVDMADTGCPVTVDQIGSVNAHRFANFALPNPETDLIQLPVKSQFLPLGTETVVAAPGVETDPETLGVIEGGVRLFD